MNRCFFRQVMIYCYFINCCIILLAVQNVLAASSQGDKNTTNKANKAAPVNGSPSPTNVKAAQKINRGPVLVPPPPPEQPSLLDWSNLSIMPESLNIFNEEELKQRLSNVRQELTNAEMSLQENSAEVADAKEKSEKFVSLYSEGVVSRKELEAAKKQAVDKERLTQEKKGKVQDLKAQESAILRRLATFKKTGKSKQTNLVKKKQLTTKENSH